MGGRHRGGKDRVGVRVSEVVFGSTRYLNPAWLRQRVCAKEGVRGSVRGFGFGIIRPHMEGLPESFSSDPGRKVRHLTQPGQN